MSSLRLRHLVAVGAIVTLTLSAFTAPAHGFQNSPSMLTEAGIGMAAVPAASAGTIAAPPAGPAAPSLAAEAAAKGAALTLQSPSAVLMEARSGRVIYQKNAHERRNPASVTKIMTLIVAFDAIRDGKVAMTDQVTISDEAAKQIGTIIFADTGETFTLAQLLESVAVGSANDAAVAVGEHVSGSVEAFVAAMNAKAKELGMKDTQFQNPTGLSAEGHFTSAMDIAIMSRYAALNYPELMRLTSIYGSDLQVPWRKNGPTFRLWNNNKLLTWYKGADGLKTGWTEAAGYCLAATAVQNGVRMISVVMGAETWKLRNAESAKLLDYGFANYTAVMLADKAKPIGQVAVARGKVRTVDAVPLDTFGVSVPKGQQSKVKTELKLRAGVEAPVVAGQPLGELIATLEGEEIGRMQVVAAGAVERANLFQSVGQQLKRLFTLQ